MDLDLTVAITSRPILLQTILVFCCRMMFRHLQGTKATVHTLLVKLFRHIRHKI